MQNQKDNTRSLAQHIQSDLRLDNGKIARVDLLHISSKRGF